MWEARAPSSSIGGRVPNPHGGHGFLRLFSNTALRREARNPDEFGESRAKELSVKRNSHPELRAPGSGPCTHDDHQRPGRLWEEHKGVSQRRVRSRWLFYRGDRGVPAASHPPSRRAMPDPCILPEGRTSPEADRHNSPWVSPTPEAKAAPAGGEVHTVCLRVTQNCWPAGLERRSRRQLGSLEPRRVSRGRALRHGRLRRG